MPFRVRLPVTVNDPEIVMASVLRAVPVRLRLAIVNPLPVMITTPEPLLTIPRPFQLIAPVRNSGELPVIVRTAVLAVTVNPVVVKKLHGVVPELSEIAEPPSVRVRAAEPDCNIEVPVIVLLFVSRVPVVS